MARWQRITRFAAMCTVVVSLAACAATFRNHGYVPLEADLGTLAIGVDTRESVEAAVGRPSSAGVLSGTAWYYVQSRVRQFAYRAPQTIDREVVAISFADNGTVANIERFGLQDGRVISLSRRVTETSIRDFGLIQQLFRNFGRINIGEALADES